MARGCKITMLSVEEREAIDYFEYKLLKEG